MTVKAKKKKMDNGAKKKTDNGTKRDDGRMHISANWE